ncbi:ABC-2 type transport system ATP-binding protein [Halobacillus karajensis]|uniref:ABC transporter ATP-binding protein YxlF n=1 Tax=Halobacillus karajensis TaxID=195088 RepID=A0A024P9K4_9BACI|nr:ABC transporter ATP-binding protein [Halobacillus karajensis]CDQ21476.1 putative ABC transporter ATP-binding protein YxlF [Halobacillus karajensis]CDQ25411.1 putative ABC transporter ATP-binding protein YxlF [Halobacillus karajensis]CDQ29735.1 putative ABC transporter ATP-binding protein YxlF [Halobacillus karajensis]SEI08066.1 ABC-2 type transport system ATP-binding protein [Halobacillus karajensis]
MTEPVMKLKNVKKTIGKKEIIKGLNFDIYGGEVFGFLGPNGAGKTTTIRMMVGLMNMSAGDVLIKGRSINKEFKEAIRHVGGIVENPEMYPFMSGWKNLVHYARMMPDITEERIIQVVRLVGLENRIKEKVGKYSLGMRQRLGIAQALLHNPSVLILDEPTNGLDPSGIREIRAYIRELAEEEGVAVIVSSHILSEMEMMCDRIGIIKNGELIAIQSVTDALQQTDEKEVSIEAAPVDEAKAALQELTGRNVQLNGNVLTFTIEKEMIPKVVTDLVHKQIQIYGVHANRSTLEDKFLDLIGEGVIE